MLSGLLSFFSTKAAQERILSGRLSQARLFLYFYLITLFDFIGLSQQALDMSAKTPTFLDYFNLWQFLIVGAIGLILLFLANGGSKGQDFLSKYFCFSFTVGIKYYLIYIVLAYLPSYFPVLDNNYFIIPVNSLINFLMVANIGLRIYQTNSWAKKA